ncbi:MAG: hypothetical protein OEO79_05910 [Gemmatimonadota bacterium]|nr:hypothetical protein [Gemmatimonadota bacterium]
MRRSTLGQARGTVLGSFILIALAGCAEQGAPGDPQSSVTAALEACQFRSADKMDCYEARLLEELDAAGLPAALAMLEAVSHVDADVEREGHVYAHGIGIRAYSPDRTLTDVFRQCTVLFQSGCYHGVIQAEFMANGVADRPTVSELCQPYDTAEDRWLFFQCLHGLGHALVMYYGHNLPRALEDCDYLTSSWNRESCYGGAFMENVISVTNPHHPASELEPSGTSEMGSGGPAEEGDHEHATMTSPESLAPWEPLKADDLHYPCSVLPERYLSACYMMQTSAILWENGEDVAGASETCGQAPEAWRRTCFQSLGRDLSARTAQRPEPSLAECQKTPEEYRAWCYVGLVKNFVDLTATTESAFSFCGLVEDFARSQCYEAVGEQIWTLYGTPTERSAACAVIEPSELRRACLAGARVQAGR